MKEIAHLAEKIAERYYEIPKGSAKWKMPDYRQHLLLCAEALYPVPVGAHVYQGRVPWQVHRLSTTKSRISSIKRVSSITGMKRM